MYVRRQRTCNVPFPRQLGDAASSLDHADANEDGELDLVTIGYAGVRVYENDGVGEFAITTHPGVIGFPRGIATLDVDHVDGPDVVVRGATIAGYPRASGCFGPKERLLECCRAANGRPPGLLRVIP